MEGQHVGPGKQAVQIHEFHPQILSGLRLGAVVGDNVHPQSLGGLGGVDADAAAAQQTEGLARQLDEGVVPVAPVRAVLPFALVDGAVMVADVQAGLQHQGDGELADGIAAVVGHVAHGDALFLGIGHVHHVVAGGHHRDELQVGTAVNDLPGHGGLVDDGNLRVTDPADGFILIGQADAVIVCHLTQGFQRSPAQVAGVFGVAVKNYYLSLCHVFISFLDMFWRL